LPICHLAEKLDLHHTDTLNKSFLTELA